jgi:hypothetical protein
VDRPDARQPRARQPGRQGVYISIHLHTMIFNIETDMKVRNSNMPSLLPQTPSSTPSRIHSTQPLVLPPAPPGDRPGERGQHRVQAGRLQPRVDSPGSGTAVLPGMFDLSRS